ncbi:carbohydrate porin [Paraburkholderia caffeinilytica]|uniref:carbohydrate porin n=1 Tax=Paraburkholderia caffeinilytica TaxID=1761016 RepID=UPI003DA17762
MKNAISTLVLLWSLALTSSLAHAQQATVADTTSSRLAKGATGVQGFGQQSGEPSAPEIAARPTDRDLLPFAASLHGLGIDTHALFLDFFMANPTTGVNTGRSGNSGMLILGADFDLGKLAGLHGGLLHVEESFFIFKHNVGTTSSFNGDVGSYMGAQLPNNLPSNYLSLLSYEQRFIDGRLQIEGGRMNPSRYFALQNCENAATCMDPIAQFTAHINPPAFATWGGRVRYAVTDTQFAQLGVFENNFSATTTNGFDWKLNNATGTLLMGEYGSKSSFAQQRLPLTYEFIGFYNTAVQSKPALVTTSTRRGTGGAMLRWQKFVWRADGEASPDPAPRSIALFGTLSGTPDPMQPYRAYAELGTTLFSPFKNRPYDRISAKVSYVRVGRDELDFQHEGRLLAGGPDAYTSPNQFRLEIDGHFAVAKGTAVEPFVQYVIHPDTFNNPVSASVPHRGVVVGLTLIVSLGDLLGISAPPGR